MVDFSGHAARAVRFQPVLPLGAALGGGRASGARPFPLDQPRVLLTFSGTAGIYQAFRAIGLRPGAVVLCPSYNCGHEIEPLIRLGLRVRCYRVGGDLEVDLDDLRRRMDREVKAVLVTHYFGFGQRLDELKTLCDRRGVFLVEDCAHALFSDNASGDLGRAGDAAVYSIRKTLPLPNGGAVLFNNPGIPMPAPLDPPPMLTTWLKALDLTRKSVVDRVRRDGSWTDLLPMAAMVPLVGSRELLIRLHPAQGTACYDPDDENLGFDSRIMDWSMSPYSAALLNRIDAGGIAARRRHNYKALAARAARRARGEAAPARAAGPHLSALSAGRGGEPGPGLPAPGAASDLSRRLVGRATPGGRLERVPGGGGAEGAGPGAAGAPGHRRRAGGPCGEGDAGGSFIGRTDGQPGSRAALANAYFIPSEARDLPGP